MHLVKPLWFYHLFYVKQCVHIDLKLGSKIQILFSRLLNFLRQSKLPFQNLYVIHSIASATTKLQYCAASEYVQRMTLEMVDRVQHPVPHNIASNILVNNVATLWDLLVLRVRIFRNICDHPINTSWRMIIFFFVLAGTNFPWAQNVISEGCRIPFEHLPLVHHYETRDNNIINFHTYFKLKEQPSKVTFEI